MNYKTTIGFKVLNGWKSINGEVTYPFNEWIEVPGNGCYVAMTGGIYSAGKPNQLKANHVMVECDGPLADIGDGIQTFRRVRIVQLQCNPLMIQLAMGMRNGNLQGADLREANLREANLQGADLRWANLRWADLQGADLQGAIGVETK